MCNSRVFSADCTEIPQAAFCGTAEIVQNTRTFYYNRFRRKSQCFSATSGKITGEYAVFSEKSSTRTKNKKPRQIKSAPALPFLASISDITLRISAVQINFFTTPLLKKQHKASERKSLCQLTLTSQHKARPTGAFSRETSSKKICLW